MPTYEYQCKGCKAVYDLRQGFDAVTTHTCEECGKGVAKRILSTPALVFKGGGWYATDSRGKTTATSDGEKKTEKATAETAPAAPAAAKTESKSESKSESRSTASENAAS